MAHLIGDNKAHQEEINYNDKLPAQSKDTKGNSSSRILEWENMRKCVFLSVAYSANLGGTGTVIGTGPNLILMGLLKEYLKI